MKTPKTYLGSVRGGKLVIGQNQAFQKHLAQLEGKDVQFTLQTRKWPRSLKQNALYWLWLRIVSEETGEDEDTLHDYFKSKYLKTTKTVFGHVYEMVRSTALADVQEFSDYLGKIKEFAQRELNITLPESYEDQ